MGRFVQIIAQILTKISTRLSDELKLTAMHVGTIGSYHVIKVYRSKS